MNLRLRITILFATLLAVLGVLAAIALVDVRAQQSAQNELTDVLNVSVAASHGLATSQARVATALSALVQDRDPDARADLMAHLDEQRTHIASLEGATASDPSLANLVLAVSRAAQGLRTDVIEPVFAQIDAKHPKQARALAISAEARKAANDLSNATQVLFNELASRQDAAQHQVARTTRTLIITLTTCVLSLVLAWLLVLRIIRLGVLDPLEFVRANLRTTATDRSVPIAIDGPVEFASLAQDAEGMRRELVRQIDDADAAREAMLQDAPVVAALQATMRPTRPSVDWLTVHGVMRAQEGVVAGDWWDVITRPDGSIALVIADVSGHGVSAGVAAVQMRATIHAALEEGALPSETMALAQHALRSSEHFLTVVIAMIERERGLLTWANAGHPAAIVVHDDKSVAHLTPTGPLLSRLPATWTDRSLSFQRGDVFFAFTDGLIEARDAADNELAEEELAQWIRAEGGHVRADATELVERMLAKARRRAVRLDDDLTVVCATRPPH